MSVLEACYDQVCTCCGKKFPVWYRYDTEKKHSEITYNNPWVKTGGSPCDCEAEFSPANGAPSVSEWTEYVKTLKPFVAKYTVTYRNTCLVWAKDQESAEKDAMKIYSYGYFDPENNGYDGCDMDVSPATPKQEEALKYDAYLWDGKDEEG